MIAPAALALSKNGLSVVPIQNSGLKLPIGKWKHLQSEIMSEEEISDKFQGVNKVGILGGKVSGSMEGLDFDEVGTYPLWVQVVSNLGYADLVKSLVVEQSPRGGEHAIYRCPEGIEGNQKLARRYATAEELKEKPKEKYKGIIETRGEGGFFVCAPTEGYKLIQGSFDNIPTITAEERDVLLGAARSFCRIIPDEDQASTQSNGHTSHDPDELRPGDDYNDRVTWDEVLVDWKRLFKTGPRTYWRRPGKKDGWSATTGNGPNDLLWVFSSSTDFEQEKGYSRFNAFTRLNFPGSPRDNYSAAASELRKRGFGDKKTRKPMEDHTQNIPDPSYIDEETGEIADKFNQSDMGNKERMVFAYGKDIRYAHLMQKFLIWDGTRFEEDVKGEAPVMGMAQQIVRTMPSEAKAILDDEKRKAFLKFTGACQSKSRLEAMISLTKKDLRVAVAPNDLDSDPWLLNCLNGTINLRNGELLKHSRDDMLTKRVDIAYDPGATCPTWKKFLLEVLDDDKDLARFIYQAIGYTLTGIVSEHVFFFLYGNGRNGKGTMIRIMNDLLHDYSVPMDAEVLMIGGTGGGQGPTPEIAKLKGVRFVASNETSDGRLNEPKIKTLTGDDRISACHKYAHPIEFAPTHKFWFSGNAKPTITGTDDGIWERIMPIPFVHQYGTREGFRPIDRTLETRLRGELPGILAWAVRGCLEWQDKGLQVPEVVRLAQADYRASMDVVGAFLADTTEYASGLSVPSGDVYRAYQAWCSQMGISKPLTQISLTKRLLERGMVKGVTHGSPTFRNLRLKEGHEPVYDQRAAGLD